MMGKGSHDNVQLNLKLQILSQLKIKKPSRVPEL